MKLGITRTSPPDRRGFTLVELVLSLVVASVVGISAVLLFGAQNRAAETQRENVDSQQNARAALEVLVREIRQAGANVDGFHKQAVMIDAAPYQIAFNADIKSGVDGDPAMNHKRTMPLSNGTVYKPGTFSDENIDNLKRFNNEAETVRLTMDVTDDGTVDSGDEYDMSHITGDFQVVRQVNGGDSETIAYGLRGPLAKHDGTLPTPLFQYWGSFAGKERALWGDTNSDGKLSQSEIAALTPVSVAELANIQQIKVSVEALADNERRTDGERDAASKILSATVRPRNIGINPSALIACGDPPDAPRNVAAVDTPEDGGRSITVTFDASPDEGGGEEDVKEYFIYRRVVGDDFDSPIYKMRATGASSYSFVNDETNSIRAENAPVDGISYEYYVTAWDCEPQESNPSGVGGPAISEPNGPEPPVIANAFDTPCDDGGDITLQFAASPNDAETKFEGYNVYRGTSAGQTSSKTLVLEVSKSGIPLYTVHDVEQPSMPMDPDSSYFYVVRAVRSGIESIDSNQWGPVTVSDGLGGAMLTEVEDVPGDAGTRLSIAWLESSSESCPVPDNVNIYKVMRKSEFESTWKKVTIVAPTGGPYAWTDTTLISDVTYEYRIDAIGAGGPVSSNIMSGKPTGDDPMLPPENVAAEDQPCEPTGSVVVTWGASENEVEAQVTHYRVFRGTVPGVYDYELAMVAVTRQSSYQAHDNMQVSGPRAPVFGVTYYYMARSWNANFEIASAASNVSDVVVETPPAAPRLTSVRDTPQDTGGSITVKFDASSHDGGCANLVTTYKVFRGTSPDVVNNWVGTVIAYQQSTYTFVDELLNSLDPPQDEVPYYYAVRAYGSELPSDMSNVMGPVEALYDVPVETVLFEDNFESNLGWTDGRFSGTNDWQRGVPVATPVTEGNTNPTAAFSGVNVLGTNLDGTYSGRSSMWAQSPKVDCQNASAVKLYFMRWLNVDDPGNDRAYIQVRSAGSSWTTVWSNSARITDSSWNPIEIDLSSVADGKRDVEIRFHLQTDKKLNYTGWNIDDFKVTGE